MIPRNRREIRTDILRENMEKIRAKVPAGVKVLAVVKADGYGHGAAETAEAAIDASGVLISFETSSSLRNILCSPSMNLSSIFRSSLSVEMTSAAFLTSTPFLKALIPTVR